MLNTIFSPFLQGSKWLWQRAVLCHPLSDATSSPSPCNGQQGVFAWPLSPCKAARILSDTWIKQPFAQKVKEMAYFWRA